MRQSQALSPIVVKLTLTSRMPHTADHYTEELIIEHQALAAHNGPEAFVGRGGCSDNRVKPDISETISHKEATTGYRVEAGEERDT